MSIDNIRKLEKVGLTVFTRNPKNNYRCFSQKDFDKTVFNLYFYSWGVPSELLNSEDIKLIRPYAKKAIRIANQLLRNY